jgi:hypothetical protein
LINRAFDQFRVKILKQQVDKHSRIYKALKINWRLFHKDTEKINRSKTQYFRGLNEYMTQQSLIDLGISTNSNLKYTYETAHQIQEAIKKQSLCQNSFNCKIMPPYSEDFMVPPL